MFPNISYPKILTLNGAFSTAAIGSSMGFRDNLDYTQMGVWLNGILKSVESGY